jgi:hypothetical protein
MTRDPLSTSATRSAGFGARQPQPARRLRAALGWLVDPEVWLRAGLIASLRERGDPAPLVPQNVQGLLEDRRSHARCGMGEPAGGGSHDEQFDRAPPSPASGSRPSLAAVADGDPSPQGLSTGTLQAAEPGLDRPMLCGGSRAGGTKRRQRPSSRRLTPKRLRQRAYLLLANWIVRTAYALARGGLLTPQAARTAFRWSSSLTKRSLAIWRLERARRLPPERPVHSRRSLGQEDPPWRRSSK